MIILKPDYGNILSIYNMLKYIGYDVEITNDPDKIQNADKIILPGVGKFDTGINFVTPLKDSLLKARDNGAYILGICLGMQILVDKSEEGYKEGLGLIRGELKKFKVQKHVPNIGWNTCTQVQADPIFKYCKTSRYYFMHSYYLTNVPKENILYTSTYEIEYISGIKQGRIYGFQFHPERSHKYGMALMKGFCEL